MKKFLLLLLLPLLAYTQEFVGPGECGVEAYFEQCDMSFEGCSDLCAEDPNCMSFMIDINSLYQTGGGCCILYSEYATEETVLGEDWLDGCCECYNMPGYEEPEPDYGDGSIMEPVTFRLDLNDVIDEIPNYNDAQVFIQTSVANWVDIPMEDIGGNGIWRKNINISHPEDENIDVFYRFKVTSFGYNGLPYTMWEGGNVDTTCLFDPGTQGLAQGDIRQILFPQELIDNGTYVNPTGEYKLTHCFNECGNEPCAPEVITYDSWVEVSFQFDQYAEEASWYLYNTTDTIFSVEEGEYDGEIDAYHFIELNSGDYTFELNDTWGDGLSWPEDGWSLVFNNCQDTLFYAEGNYGLGLIESLTIAPCAPPTEGCIDEIAINYDENADLDNGSCEYIEGCTNENASNYDPEAAVFPSGLIFPGGSCNTTVWGQNYFGVDPDFYFNGNQDIFEVGNKLYIGENTFYVDFVAEVQGNCNAPAVLIYVCYTEAEADGNLGTFSPG